MEFQYRSATQEEADNNTNKCVVILLNHMQCNHKVAKVCTIIGASKVIARETVQYCAGHFLAKIATLNLEEGNTVINLDEQNKPEVVGVPV